jgi:hypothetical protein
MIAEGIVYSLVKAKVDPMDQGLSDVIVAFQLPAQTYNGLAVPRGWGKVAPVCA